MNRSEEIEALERESDRWLFSNPERYRQIAAAMLALCRGASPEAQARAHRVHGNALRMEGKWEDALRAVRRALRLWRRAGNEVEWARTQTTLISILAKLGDNRRALAASRAGLAVFLRHEQTLPAARLLNNTGGIYLYTGRLREALRCFREAERLALMAGDRALGARTDLHQAMALQGLGRHQEALKRCAAAIRPTVQTRQTLHLARIQVAAANSLFQIGRFGKALRRFAKARTLFEGESADRDVAECDLYICACYLELNRYGPALGRLEAFLQQPGRAWYDVAWAHYYQGVALARLGRPTEVRPALDRAIRMFTRHGDRKGAGQARLEEAELLLRVGQPNEAGLLAARVQRHASGLGMARASLVRASAALATGRLIIAEKQAQQARAIAQRAHTTGLTFRALHLLGQAALRRLRYTEADRTLSAAVRLAEKMRATVQMPFRRAFLADKAAAYADLVWLRLSQGKVKAAHRLMEKAKSRALADQLSVTPAARSYQSGSEEERLNRELEAARHEYQQLTLPSQLAGVAVGARSLPSSSSDRRAWLEDHLGLLWDEWELRRLGSAKAERRSAKGRPYRLRQGEAMVEYMVAQDGLIAFVSDRRGLRGWSNLGPMEGVTRSLELLQLNLDATLNLRGSGPIAGFKKNADALLRDLYERIWAPLPWVAGADRVLVVPHGPLHQVPFSALYDGQRYLVERVELTLAPSQAVWQQCRKRAQSQSATTDLVLGFNPGEHLPFVEPEVTAVAQQLKASAWLGDSANLSRLVHSKSYRILHLAVHGQFRPDNPDFSALQLADGLLTAADVASLQLKAALVSLSACETGLSRVGRDEELTGLITAFLTAGSTSVLASLWRVDDEATAGLMVRFYQDLLTGSRKAGALQAAQIGLIQQQLHPLYWASFAIVGDGGPLPSTDHEGGEFEWQPSHQ